MNITAKEGENKIATFLGHGLRDHQRTPRAYNRRSEGKKKKRKERLGPGQGGGVRGPVEIEQLARS